MKVKDAAKRFAQLMARGAGDFEVTIFQWGYQAEQLHDIIERPGTDTIELYSAPMPAVEPNMADSHAAKVIEDWDDLI